MKIQPLFITLLIFFIGIVGKIQAASIEYGTNVSTEITQQKTKKSSWFQRFMQKRLKKKLEKRLRKQSKRSKKSGKKESIQQIDIDIDGIWIAILSILAGLGAFTFVLLAELVAVSTGMIILYWLLAAVAGSVAIWLGIEAWRESRYSDNKSLTRWLAFFGMLFGGAILYGILQPFMFLF